MGETRTRKNSERAPHRKRDQPRVYRNCTRYRKARTSCPSGGSARLRAPRFCLADGQSRRPPRRAWFWHSPERSARSRTRPRRLRRRRTQCQDRAQGAPKAGDRSRTHGRSDRRIPRCEKYFARETPRDRHRPRKALRTRRVPIQTRTRAQGYLAEAPPHRRAPAHARRTRRICPQCDRCRLFPPRNAPSIFLSSQRKE